MTSRSAPSRRVALAASLAAAGIGLAACSSSPSPTSTVDATSPTSPSSPPAATASPAASAISSREPAPSATPRPSPPAGTTPVEVPEAGIVVPIPAGWVLVPAADLADPARREELAALYPGSDALLAQADQLDGQATPVLLAVDPGAAGRGEPLAANLSVLVTQPSVGGPLLDLVAGFIADGLVDGLGAIGPADRERVALPAGDAVRIGLELPDRGGRAMTATAFVIGAPGGTVLLTLLGPASTLEGFDPDELAAAVVPAAGSQP